MRWPDWSPQRYMSPEERKRLSPGSNQLASTMPGTIAGFNSPIIVQKTLIEKPLC